MERQRYFQNEEHCNACPSIITTNCLTRVKLCVSSNKVMIENAKDIHFKFNTKHLQKCQNEKKPFLFMKVNVYAII